MTLVTTLGATKSASLDERRPILIDLFAGCGGMSLGLEDAGFSPVFVNELDADAMESYLVNRRRKFPALDRPKGRVNDIFDLTTPTGELESLVSHMRSVRDIKDVDLIVGGPPCQGYSGIGHRRTFSDLRKLDIPSNHLYREMASVIKAFRPKLFLFENVKGLLSSRWTPDGDKGEIWADVRGTFESIEGYSVRHALVQAKSYGVPQNRPRVLLVGIRDDLGWTPDPSRVADGLLPQPSGMPPDPEDFLGDLVDPAYLGKDATLAYPAEAMTEAQRWFRTSPEGDRLYRRGEPVTEHKYSRHHARIVAKFAYMIQNNGAIPSNDQTKKIAQRVIPRRWGPEGPSITATSLPDDYVHFLQPRIPTVREWARLQTFPDWYQFAGKRTTGNRHRAGDPGAGIWSRDLPKYTQIGNAVPAWLARAVGTHFREFLR
jgi:DNA (cytosine-5)-methyltransferase 1